MFESLLYIYIYMYISFGIASFSAIWYLASAARGRNKATGVVRFASKDPERGSMEHTPASTIGTVSRSAFADIYGHGPSVRGINHINHHLCNEELANLDSCTFARLSQATALIGVLTRF